ncbi:MerR family transcriptional regulator [Nocardiopsis sp. CT-R113]|uniref:MerR family transcriptional regulator n=1 Tax=Nocardiopsis codii TaxID=3065942 RepID=A0ABU7K3R8_9ACTN|nr:MerR family transcriptional regulator [Nocardiopsis sp. CT-R113]MEE2036887.1 MerR family transcriptional regulator [Nocardiopsis sp. CT-R113]
MRIGELSRRTGASIRSLRYYEEQGLLTSTRSASGQRHYTEDAVERLGYLRRMFTAGLSSSTIAKLLPCIDAPSEDNSRSAMTRMEVERDRLTEHIGELLHTRDMLDDVMRSAREHRERQAAGR